MRRWLAALAMLGAVPGMVGAPGGASTIAAAKTERVSVGGGGVQGAGYVSGIPAVSSGGRYVAFTSTAANLVPGDTNGVSDVFVRDLGTGRTTRESVTGAGAQAGHASYGRLAISGNGRFVAFYSAASNLVAGDTNGVGDVFVRDRTRGLTSRMSAAAGGADADGASYGAAMTPDARFVVFFSAAANLVPGDTNAVWDVFVRDRVSGAVRRASLTSAGGEGNLHSQDPAISADGRYVAFMSVAGDLVPGDTHNTRDVFVRDLQAGTTRRVSVRPDGSAPDGESSAPSLSADGRYVGFQSGAPDLVADNANYADDVYVRDLVAGVTRRVSVSGAAVEGNGFSGGAAMSGDGGHVAFWSAATDLVPGDTNGAEDVFVRDLAPPSS